MNIYIDSYGKVSNGAMIKNQVVYILILFFIEL